MSKSKGNVIYADDMVRLFGVDATRYFVLHEMPFEKNASGRKFFLVKIEQNGLSRPNNTKKSWKKTNE